MSYSVIWLIPDQVIFVRYTGDILLQDYAETGAMFARMIDEGVHPVHVLVDSLSVTSMPKDVTKIVAHLQGYQRTGAGWIVLAQPNKVFRFIAAVIMNMAMSTLRAHMIGSLDEAPEFLAARDDRLSVQMLRDAINLAIATV